MKILKLIIILTIALISCKSKDDWNPKYREGQIIYLKPDSLKAVIFIVHSWGEYGVSYTDSLKVRHDGYVMESEMY